LLAQENLREEQTKPQVITAIESSALRHKDKNPGRVVINLPIPSH
jgi:hypothetical protein